MLHPGPVLTLWAGPGTQAVGWGAEVVLALRQAREPRRSRQRQVICWPGGRGSGEGQSRCCILAPTGCTDPVGGTQARAAGWSRVGGAEVARVLALRPEPCRRRSRQQVTCWGSGGGEGQCCQCRSLAA